MSLTKYTEAEGTASTWTRCTRAFINNPLNSTATVTFYEEDVVSLGDKVISAERGSVSKQFSPTGIIEIRDPDTGELTGDTVSHLYLYNILYSLYINEALLRDNGGIPLPPAAPATVVADVGNLAEFIPTPEPTPEPTV